MRDYVLGKAVDLDLDTIWDYIAQDNILVADRWIDKLFNAFETLARTPGIGHKREDLTLLPVLSGPLARISFSIVSNPIKSRSSPLPRALAISQRFYLRESPEP